MTESEIARLLYHMPVVAERASNPWTKQFAENMAKRARFRNWKPSQRQTQIMRQLVEDLFRSPAAGDDLVVIEEEGGTSAA